MIYLFLSIFTSTLLFIAFKLIARNNVRTIQAIVVNYLVCVVEGSIAQRHFPSVTDIVQSDWFLPSVLMGSMFLSVFYVTGLTVKYHGMAVASIANKLSLIIPATLAFFLYDDPVTPVKILGIVAAMVAVVLTSHKKFETRSALKMRYYLFPALVLAGSGLVDACAKYCQQNYLTPDEFNLFLIFVFGVAAVMGCILLIYRYVMLKETVAGKSIVFGILLGVPNYGTMYFLIAALNDPLWRASSTFFPINNISIVITTALCGWIIFKEKLSGVNLTGIMLAVAAILLITYDIW